MTDNDTRTDSRPAHRRPSTYLTVTCMVGFAGLAWPIGVTFRAGQLALTCALFGVALALGIVAMSTAVRAHLDRPRVTPATPAREATPARRRPRPYPPKPSLRLPGEFRHLVETTRGMSSEEMADLDTWWRIMQTDEHYRNAAILVSTYAAAHTLDYDASPEAIDAASPDNAAVFLTELAEVSAAAETLGELMLVLHLRDIPPHVFGLLAAPWIQAGLPLSVGGEVYDPIEMAGDDAVWLDPDDAQPVDLAAFVDFIAERAQRGDTRVPQPLTLGRDGIGWTPTPIPGQRTEELIEP